MSMADSVPVASSSAPLPDWVRLQQALSVEAERGFCDLEGKQFRFSQFLQHSLESTVPQYSEATSQARWQSIAEKFAGYANLSLPQRQHLVAETRRLLYSTQKDYRQATDPPPSPRQVPTQSLVSASSKLALDLPIAALVGIGSKSASA
jgi:ATP-dependent DNA helicase RecG